MTGLEKTTTEKTSDESEPINVLVDAAVAVEAKDGSELRKSDIPSSPTTPPVSPSGESHNDKGEDDDEENPAASDKDKEGEETASNEDNVGEPADSNGDNVNETAASDEEKEDAE